MMEMVKFMYQSWNQSVNFAVMECVTHQNGAVTDFSTAKTA